VSRGVCENYSILSLGAAGANSDNPARLRFGRAAVQKRHPLRQTQWEYAVAARHRTPASVAEAYMRTSACWKSGLGNGDNNDHVR